MEDVTGLFLAVFVFGVYAGQQITEWRAKRADTTMRHRNALRQRAN
jgi:hypothetical protein